MRQHPARAMYDQLEDTLTSITVQLRSAIQADASMPPRVNGKVNGPADCAGGMRTTRDGLKSLAGCGDAASLRSAVSELCAEFGKVTRIDILTMAEAEKRRALCFLRLESEAQERQLMNSLGVSRFGNDLLVIVDLALDETAQS
jgi:hypothetical protein